MSNVNPLCHQCRCLDTTSLTESGHVCLVGEEIESTSDCDLFINKKGKPNPDQDHFPVNQMLNCIEALSRNGNIVASASETYVVRSFRDGNDYVTTPDDSVVICAVSSELFTKHFEEKKLINAHWVKLNAKGTLGRHKNCGSPVYEDDNANRRCIDKNCMGSYYGINLMEDLVGNWQLTTT